jgi:hypothetical protein
LLMILHFLELRALEIHVDDDRQGLVKWYIWSLNMYMIMFCLSSYVCSWTWVFNIRV